MVTLPNKYYNGFIPSSDHVEVLAKEGEYFFAQDQNARQSMSRHQLKSVGDAVLRDGNKVEGCGITINSATGDTKLDAGLIYIDGFVRELSIADLLVPALGKLQVGVMVIRSIETSLQNPELKFKDQSFEAHNAALQPRMKEACSWELSTDVPADTPTEDHFFYPVYDIIDRVVLDTSPPPELSGFNSIIAKYDREANGNGYAVEGFKVSLLSSTADVFVLSVEEGTVNVYGLKVERTAAIRLTYPTDPDLEQIDSEPHYFNDGGTGTLQITLNRTPVFEILNVSILEEKTVTVLRGQAAGGRDPLPDAQIAGVVSIIQAATTFDVVTSWQLIGDEVDWSAVGDEPATGSSYQVTYQYKKSIAPDAISETSATVSGAVTGSQVDIDYKWKMPRIDLIKVDKSGNIERIKGISRAYNPAVPSAPDVDLTLAEIHHTWDGPATIYNIATNAVPMRESEAIRDLAVSTHRELARMQLVVDANIANGYAKSAIFADNFDDDEQRDNGIVQNLSISNGMLQLPIYPTIIEGLSNEPIGWINDFNLVPVMSQLLSTGSMKINPFQAFAPLPVRITLDPAFDQWTTSTDIWTSAITRTLATIRGFVTRTNTSVSNLLLRSTTTEQTEMRVRNVDYSIEGFGPNEALASLQFDGIGLELPDPLPTADIDGRLTGQFTIPAGLTTGSKAVTFESATGSIGEANYIGRGQITINEMRRVTTVQRVIAFVRNDPLGYLWSPPKSMPIGNVKVKVTAIGDPSNPVVMQIRNVVSAQPTGIPLAEVEVDMTNVQVGDVLDFTLPIPLWVEAFSDLANIWLTADADHSLAIAELAKFDPDNGWVRSQPSVNMVTIASSNNQAFIPYHNIDLWTEIEEAEFTEIERTIELGEIPALATTDLLVLGGVESPTAETEVEFLFERGNGSQIRAFPNQTIELSEEINEVMTLKAVLKGSVSASPVLFSNIQAFISRLEGSGYYYSRSFNCGADRTVEITTYENTPGSSQFTVSVKDNLDAYIDAVLQSQVDEGDGWYKRIWRVANLTADTTAVRIYAQGSAQNRPVMAYMHAAPLEI